MGDHKRLRALLAAVLLLTALLGAGLGPGGAARAIAGDVPYTPDRLVARLEPGRDVTISEINADYGTSTIEEFAAATGIYLLSTPPGEDAARVATRMRADQRLDFVELNYQSGAPEARPRKVGVWGGIDPAPRFSQYALDHLGLAKAHAITEGEGITVAVIDTGVQLDHPALADHLLSSGYDFVDGDSVPEDVPDGADDDEDGSVDEALGHGSHVAGIVLLVAPAARILPIRALNADGIGETYQVALAIEYAIDHGADVINLSLGTDLYSELLAAVVRRATQAGILVVAAAGNDGTEAPQFPAADPCAVGVTSVDEHQELSPFATLPSWVDLAAPGESIYSAMIPSGYGWWSGTSMAAPFVSGQAALMLAARPRATVSELAALAVETAQELHASGDQEGHSIDVGASVELARSARYINSRRSFIPRECRYTLGPPAEQ